MRSEVDIYGFSIAKEQPGRENQDFFDYQPEEGLPAPDWSDFAAVVADGVGSSGSPRAAAAAAAQNWLLHARAKFIENSSKCAEFDEVHFNEISRHAFSQAHEAVQQKAGGGSACAAAVCLQGNRLLVANIGDCRVYLARGVKLERLSEDQVDTAGDPTQVIGGKRAPEPYTTASVRVQAGDVIILCSDGVWKLLTPADLQLAASGRSAREIAAAIQKAVTMRKNPGSDDATAVVALVKKVGRPHWETDTESGDGQLKDDLDMKINEVLAELLNRLRTPLERQTSQAEKALNQLGMAVDELKSEIDSLKGETGNFRRNRKQSGADSKSVYSEVGLSILMIIGGIIIGWMLWGPMAVPKTYRGQIQLPENAHIISQTYENDRVLIKFAGEDKKPRLAIYRLEDGGRPFAIIDLPTEKKTDGSVP